MKNVCRKVLVAAMAGLLSGAALRQGYAEGTNTTASTKTNTAPGKPAPAKKLPKVHDCAGDNECKGLGGCKTDDNSCKFKNACNGKGGCALTKKDIQEWEKKQKDAAAKPPSPADSTPQVK
jgi:hypothetical protein